MKNGSLYLFQKLLLFVLIHIGKMNSNGLHLLSFCAEYQLCITNTLFKLPDKSKVTWMHPRYKNWYLLDYVIICSRDIQDIHITRAMRGAECWTDAVLRPPARKQPPKPCLNVADLGNIEVRRNLIPKLDSELDPISISGDLLDDNQANQDVEELWSSMIDVL